MNSKLKNSRYLGALLLSPLIIFLFIGGTYLKAGTFIISIFAMYEVYKVVKSNKDYNPIPLLGYSMLIVFYILNLDMTKLGYLIILFSLLLLCIPIINLKYNFIDMFITLGVFIYAGVFFSFIPGIYSKPYGNYLVWLIFISSWLGDTLAYYTGKYLGKNKLCPKVSPKKTIEGSIGGLIGSTLGCGIFGIIISKYISGIPLIHFFLIGALSGIMGQFGDLTASSIKRFFNVKDYSHLIPGHGGIMDRFDSIIFSAVIIFYYITFIISI